MGRFGGCGNRFSIVSYLQIKEKKDIIQWRH